MRRYMKILIIIIMTLILSTVSVRTGAASTYEYEVYIVNRYFDMFLSDYKKIRRWEGNYCNIEYDKGGETYGGIARNFNRKWEGWKVLDKYKKTHTLKWNDIVDEVEPLVIKYYQTIWMNEKYYQINDQFVRSYLFDYRNSGTIAYKHAKMVLNEHGFETKPGAKLDKHAIVSLNKINPIIFILHLQEVRRDYYTGVADRNPEMQIFLKGWINRANNIAV